MDKEVCCTTTKKLQMESTMDEQHSLHNELWKQGMGSPDWCNWIDQLCPDTRNKTVEWNAVHTKNFGFSRFHGFIQTSTTPQRNGTHSTRLRKAFIGEKGRRQQV